MMSRPLRAPNSVLGRPRGTHNRQQPSAFALPEGSASASAPPEAPGRISTPSGHHRSGEGQVGQPTARAGGNPGRLASTATPAEPPGLIVFKPPAAPRTDYPRWVRQLSPNEDRLVQPDLETGKWPRLNPSAVAEPTGARRMVDWSNRPPSRSAYANWLRDSAPLPELELAVAAE
jgi:hypothetical protein